MKCSKLRYVNTAGPHNGKPIVLERTFKFRGKAAVIMRNMTKTGDKNLTIVPVNVDGCQEFAIVRTSHNGL